MPPLRSDAAPADPTLRALDRIEALIGTLRGQHVAPSPDPARRALVQILRERRLRERCVPARIARSDAAWTLLLALGAYGPKTSGELAELSRHPPTTALRQIQTLTDAGLVARCADPEDQRRIVLALSAPGQSAIETFLAMCAAG